MNSYHTPVLAESCVKYLNPQPGGVYVDATLGGGGHALALLQKCPQLRLYGFDQDPEAIAQARATLADYQDQVEFIPANFVRQRTELALRQVKAIDGVLFDLGVSSHQLDTPERGFSFDREAPLDMRMDGRITRTAEEIVNQSSQSELAKIFKEWGEEPQAGRIARKIVEQRNLKPVATTRDLARLIEQVYTPGTRDALKAKVRIFQAMRICVNRELEVLEPALQDAINLLKPQGRIVVLSYHSLEDRIVKNTFRRAAASCVCPPGLPQCVCGKKRQLELLTKRPLTAEDTEVESNVRSRSVRLRAAEKLMGET